MSNVLAKRAETLNPEQMLSIPLADPERVTSDDDGPLG